MKDDHLAYGHAKAKPYPEGGQMEPLSGETPEPK